VLGNSHMEQHAFRWLHISDLHLVGGIDNEHFLRYLMDGNRNSHDQLEQEGLTGILKSYGGVDCIVATGDFFNRGKVDVDSRERVKQTIEKIYNQCAENSQWLKTDYMKRLCFCPGNHDLIRDAVSEMDENYKRIERKQCIQNVGNRAEAHLSVPDKERNLIVRDTFKPFFETMPNLDNREDIHAFGDGQIVCFCPRARDTDFKPIVIMIGLNTALLAGQHSECLSIWHDTVMKEIHAAFVKACKDREYDKAKQDMATALDRIMQINQDKIDDHGKLCLPERNTFCELQKFLDNKREASVIPVLFGHHTIDFFNIEAQKTITEFINKNKISLYLCGHSHQVSDGPINTMPMSRFTANTCLQVTSGGMFLDEQRFNQISFSVGTITWDSESKKSSIAIDYYICMTDADNTHPIGIWTQGQSIWSPQFYRPTVNEEKPTNRGGENKPIEIKYEKRTEENTNPKEEITLQRGRKVGEPKISNEQTPIVELLRMDYFTRK